MRYLVVLAGALAVAASPVSAAVDPAPSIEGRGALEREIIVELNQARAERDLQPLRVVRGLRSAAVAHSTSMLRVGYFDHASADGTSFDRRLARHYPEHGWRTWSVGETLLATSAALDAPQIVAEWMKSRPHREIILSSTWRDVGIGARFAVSAPNEFDGAPTTVVTADFGLRAGKESGPRG